LPAWLSACSAERCWSVPANLLLPCHVVKDSGATAFEAGLFVSFKQAALGALVECCRIKQLDGPYAGSCSSQPARQEQ
jgi:hypothetical protein